MARIFFHCEPYAKEAVTLALESGVDGLIIPAAYKDAAASLARCPVWTTEETPFVALTNKEDEQALAEKLRSGEKAVLAPGWEVIPVENLLAQCDNVLACAENLERAKLASGILEKGVAGIVVPREGLEDIKQIVAQCKIAQHKECLSIGRITKVVAAGLGHRVCLDTIGLFKRGEGMLVGNSGAFAFLVHAETEYNEYVAARPFRVNAGAVHAYILLPDDKTAYLGELKAGEELLAVNYSGTTSLVTLGRVKTEIRPMLLIEAQAQDAAGELQTGAIFLQNAETIRLTRPDGVPISVVDLKEGDEILCRLDQPGRHFGMRIKEEISES